VKNGIETFGSMEDGEFFDWLSDYRVVKKGLCSMELLNWLNPV